MKRLIIVVILVTITIGIGIAFYNDSVIPLSEIEVNQKTIVLITKMKYGDYWKSVLKGAEAAEQEFGITLVYDAPNEEDDIQGQIDMVEFYIDRNVDGIVLAASDYEALVPVVEKAFNNGIPVVLIDSHVNSNSYNKSFSTDNYLAGKQAGESLIDLAGEDAKIGIISFVKGSENAIQRERGLKAVLEEYPNIEIVDTMFCGSSIEVAETFAMIYLDQEVDAIIGLNAIASMGLGRALNRHKDAIGIGFDTTLEEITFIDQEIIDATIVQNPYGMGYLGVKYAAIGSDEAYPDKDNKIDTFVISSENMFLKENQKLVFPFNVE